jgi:hypothetical protein
MKKTLALLLSASVLSACSTTDFSTPIVNMQYGLNAASSTVCAPSTSTTDISTPSVDNARSLIQNFILIYRCRSREAANGRQLFQVPAFMATTGAAAAGALGGGSDYGIVGGVLNAVFNAGNSYYSPQQQATIYNSALDAFVCIQTEAVGVEAFLRPEDVADVATDEGGGGEGDPAVYTSAAVQYYDMIRAALFSVELVTARRLMTVGTFDPAGVVAEITALNREIEEGPDSESPNEPGVTDDEGGGGAGDDAETVRLEIEALRPKLQRCVVRAKI